MTTDPLIHSNDSAQQMDRLLAIMAALRNPQTGCPWDIDQTFATVAPYTIEEAYEVADAIERGDMDDLRGELGDLLFQSVFHAQIAHDAGHFNFSDVARTMSDKMIARHPHVFGPKSNKPLRDKSVEQQTLDWETIKAAERVDREEHRTLDGVAIGLPALLRAFKLQKRAARVGFDWPDVGHVIDKIAEEAAEVVEARDTLTHNEVTEEVGDLLFVVANLARHLNVDPEVALRQANTKFKRRFEFIEDALARDGRTPSESNLTEMDTLWNTAKDEEKAAKSI